MKRQNSVNAVKVTTKHLVSNFCQETSAHGFANITREKALFRKLLWVFLVILAIVVTVVQLSELFGKHFSYPSEGYSNFVHESLEMPSVTVCNINPVSNARQGNYSVAQFKIILGHDGIARYIQQAAKMNKNSLVNEHLHRTWSPLGMFEQQNGAVEQFGHSFDNFVIRCVFNNKDCDRDYFRHSVDSQYYNCYTFNGINLATNDSLVSKTTGPRDGLSLILYLESDDGTGSYGDVYDMSSNVANGAGARVVVHPPKSMPNPLDMGFDVPPGYSTSVGLRLIKRTRLGKPYDECTTRALTTGTPFTYTYYACLKICQQMYIVKRCKCMSSELPVIGSTDNTSLLFCGHFNFEDINATLMNYECEVNAMSDFVKESKMRDCACSESCHDTSYRISISQSYWPLERFSGQFIINMVHSHPKSQTLNAYQTFSKLSLNQRYAELVRKNFLRLNIYYEELQYEDHHARKAYAFPDLFSDIGGTLGLWIGISMLTLCEIIELGFRLIRRVSLAFCRNDVTDITTDTGEGANNNRRNKKAGNDKKTISFIA